MQTTVIIPYRPRGENGLLEWTLEGYARQELAAGHSLDVRVGIDGADDLLEIQLPTSSPFPITIHRFAYMGASGVRNALVRETSPESHLLILGNADGRPEPDMVQHHIDTMSRLPPNSLVLGAAPWERIAPTVFDAMIDQTPMIFSFCHMKPHVQYDFRAAYSLNLGVRREEYLACGGFPEEMRPYYYEDLVFACRLLGPTRKGVVYEPAAKVLHRHPLTVDQYLDREELLGMVAPVLARVCPDAFGRLLANRTVERLERELRARTLIDPSVFRSIYGRILESSKTPAETLGEGEGRTQRIKSLYQLHIPLKLVAFRLGFLKGIELADDAHWQLRKPQGLWQKHILS